MDIKVGESGLGRNYGGTGLLAPLADAQRRIIVFDGGLHRVEHFNLLCG
jgi:hypothetical protein